MKRDLMRSQTNRADRFPVTRRSSFLSPWFDDYLEPMRLFDDFFGRDLMPYTGDGRFLSPAIDIDETENEYLIAVDLPGIKKEDISVECVGNQLTISAERKYEMAEGRRKDRAERFHGTYQRSFTLPAGADNDKIEAACEHGVLTIRVPKGEQAKSKRIQIGEKKFSLSGSKH